MTWLAALLIAGATYRITRLIVTDEISERLRHLFRDRHRRQEQRAVGALSTDPPLAVRYVRRPGRPVSWLVWRVVSCSWCTSVYVAAVLTLLWWAYPDVMPWVCAAATASAATGLVAERD